MDMTFTQFLIQFAWNLLTSIIPMAALVYVGIRMAIRHEHGRLADRESRRKPIKGDRDES